MLRVPIILLLLSPVLPAEEDPRLDFALGILAETRGQQDEAGRRFESARLADPTAIPLVQRAVAACIASGDRPAAVKLYRDLAAGRPDDLGIQLAYSDFLEQTGRGDALAIKLSNSILEGALTKNPGNPEIIRRLFQQAQIAGDKAHQLELMELLSKEDPASVLLYTSLSRGIFEAKNSEAQAMVDEHYLRSLELHPDDASLARSASDHFHDTGRADKAIAILKRHVETSPSSLELRTRLGILYFEAKQDNEGEAALKEVLEINPRQTLAHQSLAKCYRLRGKPDLARLHAGEVLKLRGGSVSEFLNLADEWLAAGEPRKARLLLENAVFDHPNSPELMAKLAIATRRDPETSKQAARLFRQAEAALPTDGKNDPAFLMESAEALIDDGQSKSAEERMRNAIRGYPAEAKKETAAALRRLASLWESEKRNTEAAKALRQRADALDR